MILIDMIDFALDAASAPAMHRVSEALHSTWATDFALAHAEAESEGASPLDAVSVLHAAVIVPRPENALIKSALTFASELSKRVERVDAIIALAMTGKNFAPSELLAMQAFVYQTTLEMELASKLVEKGTSAIKQLFNTQV